jgi:hypothetical protein
MDNNDIQALVPKIVAKSSFVAAESSLIINGR